MTFSKVGEEADSENRNDAGHAIFRPGNQLVPDNEPNWDYQNNREEDGRQRLVRYKIMILKGIQVAGNKPVKWNKIKEINQEPTENTSAFLEHLRECLPMSTTTDLESLEANAILRSYFISQSASDIRHKLQKLELEPDIPNLAPGRGCLLGV